MFLFGGGKGWPLTLDSPVHDLQSCWALVHSFFSGSVQSGKCGLRGKSEVEIEIFLYHGSCGTEGCIYIYIFFLHITYI